MASFPKTPRFRPNNGSEVPSPGRYNPLLHDPSQDPWRKGPLEIFKAPRSKEPDRGPDTFGLYNPDQIHDNIHGSRPRPRAVSTAATPSKHHKELLRLETQLSQRELNITHLTETLHKSEKTMEEIRKALTRSEDENSSLQDEAERLRKQLQGIAGLHKKVIELESEHEKSKKRREKEISHLKAELRSAEDRASRYHDEKKTLEEDLKRFQISREHSEKSLQKMVQRNTLVLTEYLQKVFDDCHASNGALRLEKSLSKLEDICTKKVLADRASQVAELVLLLNRADSREDLLYELLDDMLKTNEMQFHQSIELVADLESERGELRNCLCDLQAEMQSRQQLSNQLLREKDVELELTRQQTSLAQIELSDARLVSSSREKSLLISSQAYSDLSSVCHSQVEELNTLHKDLATRDGDITEFKKIIQAKESQIVELTDGMDDFKEKQLLAVEAWHLKESELQSSLMKNEKDLKEEKVRRSKLSAELMVARQAEAALHGEVEHARNLSAQIEETERENERLRKINDLIMRQSNMNAIEVERVEKLNAELVSQHNPAQKVKVLDRMRKEIKEEKENTARLENKLWAANSEIKSLKEELSAYQSTSHPKSTSAPQNVIGTSRVTRPPLSEVTTPFATHPAVQPATNANEKPPCSTVTMRKPSKPQPSNVDQDKPTTIDRNFVENLNNCRLPILQKNHQDLLRKRDELMKNTTITTKYNTNNNRDSDNNNNNGETSLGAIKMQGKMTLDELR